MYRETVFMKYRRLKAEELAEERILDALLPPARDSFGQVVENEQPESSTRQVLRKRLRQGELDDKEIELEISASPVGVEIMAPPGMEEMTSQLQGMFQNMGGNKTQKRKMRIKDAMPLLIEEESARLGE